MKANKNQAMASTVAGMGGYGCMMYNATGSATTFVPEAAGRHIAVIQALTDTIINHVSADWMAPAAVDGVELPAGNCLFVKAASVSITDGNGILYYGIGDAVEPEETEAGGA